MEENYCSRTFRACIGGAYDGDDGWGIDCALVDPSHCIYKIEDPWVKFVGDPEGFVKRVRELCA